MSQKIAFEIANAEIIDERDESQFSKLRIDAFASGDNRHNLFVSEDTLRRTAHTIYQKPMIWAYNRFYDDVDTHSELTVPCGFVVSQEQTFRTLDDGRLMMTVEALIWKRYSGQLMELFKRDNGIKSVSVEMEVFDIEKHAGSNDEIMDFQYCAICILGDQVTPAIPDAQAEVVRFAQEYQQAYEEEFSSKYDELNFRIPRKVKANAQFGLDLFKQHNRGGSNVALASARFLANNSKATPQKVKEISKYFAGHNSDDIDDIEPPSDEFIAWNLWGGIEGARWSLHLAKKIDAVDQRRRSYFGGSENPMEEEFAKEKLGTGESLKVDKSKDALSNRSWGSVDKTSLRNRILEASNYKSLVRDCYLLVEEGWEDAPSSHLKYPVMCIEGGTLVYNKGGLSSALGYAKAEGENSVVSKVEAIQRKMGIDSEENKKEVNNSMKQDQTEEKPEEMAVPEEENPEEEEMATPEEKPEEKPEEGKDKEKPEDENMATPKEKPEDGDQAGDGEGKPEEKTQMDAPESEPEDKPEDDDPEEGEEKPEEEMSLDINADVAAVLAMLGEETAEHQAIASEFAKPEAERNYCSIVHAMYACMKGMSTKCEQMSADLEAKEKQNQEYATENEQLKAFKADVDKNQFAVEVEATLRECASVMPEEEVNILRDDAMQNHSLETLEGWKNKAKAKAFTFAKVKEQPKDGIHRYGLPFAGTTKKTDSLWK